MATIESDLSNSEDDQIGSPMSEKEIEEPIYEPEDPEVLSNRHDTANSSEGSNLSGKLPNIHNNGCNNSGDLYSEIKKTNAILNRLIIHVKKTEKHVEAIEEKLESSGISSGSSSGSSSKKQKKKISNYVRVSRLYYKLQKPFQEIRHTLALFNSRFYMPEFLKLPVYNFMSMTCLEGNKENISIVDDKARFYWMENRRRVCYVMYTV